MSFISNVDHVVLGDGVYNNVQGNIVHNNFYVTNTIHRVEIDDEQRPPPMISMHPLPQRLQQEAEHGIKIIRRAHLKLTREIGCGPGYHLHAGRSKGRPVIVKVFDAGPTVRQHLESTAAFSRGLFHPNILRIQGISPPSSLIQFITYENVRWKNAEGPLAMALKDELPRSFTLGFRMLAGLSAGLNYLSTQGISLASIGVEDFDILLDTEERFLLCINAQCSNRTVDNSQNAEDQAWGIFNGLSRKVLRSANRALHNEAIDRNPVSLESLRQTTGPQRLLGLAPRPSEVSKETLKETPDVAVPPRREYVWRDIDRGRQSLATIADRLTLDLDMKLSPVHSLQYTDTKSAHRCPGYVREEIILAATIGESAMVSHDTPSPLEICSVCHEIVDVNDTFKCVCGNTNPGSRHTVKCRVCKVWSHSDCVGNPKEFKCASCVAVLLAIAVEQHNAAESVMRSTLETNSKEADKMQQSKASGVFRCVCGDPKPGLQDTIRCQVCKAGSHSKCVGNAKEFKCISCLAIPLKLKSTSTKILETTPRLQIHNSTQLTKYFRDRQASSQLTWVENSTGPSHRIQWRIECKVSGHIRGMIFTQIRPNSALKYGIKGTGIADNKATAKEEAARQTIIALGLNKKYVIKTSFSLGVHHNWTPQS
ncbi:hypothetical protein MVEN_00327800 [Mycena venus]|uniref:DRBM domain-containing protein n=1 Tax=Mycena venus TaxID=2733690 RepID=A0A8H7DA78_9AGAR|nr:hypothetical protein MVEN_00327800 [Mycena venus]